MHKAFFCTINQDNTSPRREIIITTSPGLAQHYLKTNNIGAVITVREYNPKLDEALVLTGGVESYTYWKHSKKETRALVDQYGMPAPAALRWFMARVAPLVVPQHKTIEHDHREALRAAQQRAARNFPGLSAM